MKPVCLFWVWHDYSILSSQKWQRLGCMSGFKPSAALQNPGLQLSLAKLWGRTPPIPPAYFLESHAVTHNWQMSSVHQLGEPLSRNCTKLLLVVVGWCRFHSCLLNSGWESINWSKKNTSHKAISSHSGQVAQELCLSPSLCLLFRLQPVSCASVRPLWDVEMVKLLRTGSMSAHSEPTHAAVTPHSCKKWCRSYILHLWTNATTHLPLISTKKMHLPGWLIEPPPILLASYLNLSRGTVWGFIAGIRSRTFAGHRR